MAATPHTRASRIWRRSRLDGILVALSLAQFATTFGLACEWASMSLPGRLGSFVLLVCMTAYNIIVLSHLFTHVPWFKAAGLNSLISMVNSANAGQSVQAYELQHVRNHHRYNNDAKDADGTTRDVSSTFRKGVKGEHASLFEYVCVGAWKTWLGSLRECISMGPGCCLGSRERELRAWLSRSESRRNAELRQIQLDRLARCVVTVALLAISWRWTLECYLPAFYFAFMLVNVQNYYEHYGANPGDRGADSVSYYGRFYNLFTFNDGFHQEHHLRPSSHWRQLPNVRVSEGKGLAVERVVSPVPAVLGFLHRGRPLLHRSAPSQP